MLRRPTPQEGRPQTAAAAESRSRLILAALLLAAACAGPGSRFEGGALARGAVVSEHPLATRVGVEVLEHGGNAADAAVATALALAVVYPQAGNLGGGGFALCFSPKGETLALDFRETAPAGAQPERYLDPDGRFVPERSVSGALAVGVPGSPGGLYQLYRRFGSGRLTFRELAAPAIRLAREGFPVDPWLARDLAATAVQDKMSAAAREVFFPDGEPLRRGARLCQPDLARTLERYAQEGPDAIYRGPIAQAIVRAVLSAPVPGLGPPPPEAFSSQDLADYRAIERKVLRGWFRGNEVLAMPPPSSGGVALLQVLGMLDGLPLEAERERGVGAGDGEPVGERMLHWWIEAMRLAFADRAAHLGDPDHYDVPVDELLSAPWIAARRVSIGERAQPDVGAWFAPPAESAQTTHVSVLDRAGGAVSLTTTLNATFGSGIMVEGAGFLLNNELDDFAIQAGAPNMFGLVGSEANALAPSKRPLSSMSPAIVLGPDRKVRLVAGSPGGPRIITAVIQVVLRVLVMGQDLRDAMRAPRLHQQWSPPATRFEATARFRWERATLAALRGRGHEIVPDERTFGSVQAILIDASGRTTAFSDPRRGGAAGLEGLPVDLPARPPR